MIEFVKEFKVVVVGIGFLKTAPADNKQLAPAALSVLLVPVRQYSFLNGA